MNVPFLDLRAQYLSIKREISEAIQEVLDTSAFSGGPFVQKFESEWAAYCGVKHAVGVGNGTDALWLALRALDIGPGDEVITVPNTFIATAEAISLTGATPTFVDVDETYYTMNPGLFERSITARTKAVIPVHLFGQTADMDPIKEIAHGHGLYVIEDACQAHGATYKGQKAGSIGDAAGFSFYPGKNLGAYGEAGAVTTDNDEVAARVRVLRDHGQSRKHHHDLIGWNARMDGIQGAVLSVKLRHLEKWNKARREKAAMYGELLNRAKPIALPKEADSARHAYHVYAVRVRDRDRILRSLMERGIECGTHYPFPVHLQKAYACSVSEKGSLPIAERCADEFLSLPIYPELTIEMIDFVSRSLFEAAQGL